MEATEYQLMDAAEESMWWYRALHRRLLDALDGVQGVVLDAGCGTGGFLAKLRSERPDLDAVGVDVCATAAERAAVKSGRPACCASLEDLPFDDGSFDAVVSADVLCHRSLDPHAALREIGRVLRPGGRLVLNLPAHEWLRSAHDRRVHTARRTTVGDLRRLLSQCGYAHVKSAHWNALLLPLMVVERKVLARAPNASSDVRPFPPWIDSLFFGVTELERRLPPWFPAGGSVMAVAEFPDPTAAASYGVST